MIPVPLSLLDELFLNLDQAHEPWGVHLEVRVGGRLDPAALSTAIRSAGRRHPMARARLAPWQASDRNYRWETADELDDVALTVVDCDDEARLAGVREELFSVSPSLAEPPPFRVVLARSAEGDSVLLNLHHAAGDGVSAMRLMLSILRAYAGEEDPVPSLDELVGRDFLALTLANSRKDRATRQAAFLRESLRRLSGIERVARDGGDDRPGYGFVLLPLSPEQTQAVFAKRAGGTTVNDVLLAALAVAIRRWNAGHGRAAGNIALTMPVNLRPQAWRDELFANLASYVTVLIGAEDHGDLVRALQATGERTRELKRDALAGLAVDRLVGPNMLTVAAKRRLQGLIPLTGNVVVDTASLSNLGSLDGWPSLGDGGSVEGVWFSPPGRMPLGAALGVVSTGGRLHVTVRYPRAQFGPPAAQAFADVYRDVLVG
jgi:NRPS condensation-like uncharacterized protein